MQYRRLISVILAIAVLLSITAAIADAAKKSPPKPAAQTVYITTSGKCFHRDGCSSLRKSKTTISRTEAIMKGYRPCKRCNP